MTKKSYRSFSGEQKMAILKRHLVDRISVSELCSEYDIRPSLFYKWQQELFANGETVFTAKRKSRKPDEQQNQVTKLKNQLEKKDEVLLELMQEHILLKKSIAGRD